MKNGKKWCICFAVFFILLAVVLGGITATVDPYFHYHAPMETLAYPLNNQRYQNDGIVKHFDYNAIITGTSVTENFHASDLERLFGFRTIKVPLSGGSYKEVNDMLRRACKANKNIEMVVRSLDAYMLFYDKDYMHESFQYPYFLYDTNLFNDAEYIFNKEVLLDDVTHVLEYTKAGCRTTNFDEYSNWETSFRFCKESVFERYNRPAQSDELASFDEETRCKVQENVYQNVIALAEEYPDVQFYCFYPPYSIVWWDETTREGRAEQQIEALKCASEMLLEVNNIHLYSFTIDENIIMDLSNYKDLEHFSAEINTYILECMKAERFLLTKENNEKYWEDVSACLTSFGYDAFFEEEGYFSSESHRE